MYNKLDLESLFSAYWYAKEIAKSMDLPILAGALEHLVKNGMKKRSGIES